jgi:hypothetical protein
MGGGISALLSTEKFVPNNAIPGQTSAVLDVANALNISRKDVNKLYSAYIRLHTEGVTFKIVINYMLLAIGVAASPFNHGLFKVRDEMVLCWVSNRV